MEALLAAGARPGTGITVGPFAVGTPLTAAGNEEIKRALRAVGAGWPSFIVENLRGILVLMVLSAIVVIGSKM